MVRKILIKLDVTTDCVMPENNISKCIDKARFRTHTENILFSIGL